MAARMGSADDTRGLTRLFLGIIGVAVLGGTVAIGLWWIDHDPLEIVHLEPPAGATAVREPEGTVLRVPYADGAVVTYEVTVRNTEALTMRLHAVDPDLTYGRRLLRPTAFQLGAHDPQASAQPDAVLPFRPVSLAQGETVTITVFARFSSCEHFTAGTSSTIGGHALRIGFGPLRKTVRLAFDEPLSVRSPGPAGALGATGECPREAPQPPAQAP